MTHGTSMGWQGACWRRVSETGPGDDMRRVLAVDDELGILAVVQEILENSGYTALT